MTKADHAEMTIAEARQAILAAMIAIAGNNGWTERSLDAALQDAGVTGPIGRLAYPGGVSGILTEFCSAGDRAMEQALEAVDLAAMKTGARIAAAVKARLEVDAGHKDAVRTALTALARPLNAPLALSALYKTVDSIWRVVGDNDGAREFSFYSKRASLAGVYSATVLYWLADRSVDHEKTWRFLDDRLKDVVKIGQMRSVASRFMASAPSPLDILAGVRRGIGRGGFGRGRGT